MSRWLEVPIPMFLGAKLWPNAHAYLSGPLRVMVSDDDDYGDGRAWMHVSVSCVDRLPTWEELKRVRYEFFPPDAEVVQVFPPRGEYRNWHQNCLHLWRCKSGRLTPPLMADAVAPRPGEPVGAVLARQRDVATG